MERPGAKNPSMLVTPTRARAVIDAVRPCVDGGRYDVKRVVGEAVRVEADVFADGHDWLGCVVRWRYEGAGQDGGDEAWRESPMRDTPNDVWVGSFTPTEVGAWSFRVVAWVDPLLTWQRDLARRVEAGQDVSVDLQIGAGLLSTAARAVEDRGRPEAARPLREWAGRIGPEGHGDSGERARAALSEELTLAIEASGRRPFAVESEPIPVWVERPKAQFSAWYEMFPRSASPEPGQHGTLEDVRERLPYVAEMGFDVLYLPPIHPIGTTFRKGPNNAPEAGPDDPGSPWAIGGPEGGHKAIHPQLGTFDDFERLVETAREFGIELALDIAFQCSPDHPYVKEHPGWFRHRPDGSIQYAENPPKKYQDIYPFDFECEDYKALWAELKSVFDFWIGKGVSIFRVDNPHTKPLPFWDWVISEIRREHPGIIFLAEAFTRPKRLYRLAKGGFSQSYTYFAWRPSAHEMREYVEQLVSEPFVDQCRPNFWPNTPDILVDELQRGGRPAAMAKLVLAATLSPSYGIYGPVYELCEFTQRPGSEENLDNEKYEIRRWDLDNPWSLRHFIGLVNRIRRENPALQQLRDVTFHRCDNPAHLAYSKKACPGEGTPANVVLCIVNNDPHHAQWGTVRLDLGAMGVSWEEPYEVEDLLTGVRYTWRGPDNGVGLEPGCSHIMLVRPEGGHGQDLERFE